MTNNFNGNNIGSVNNFEGVRYKTEINDSQIANFNNGNNNGNQVAVQGNIEKGNQKNTKKIAGFLGKIFGKLFSKK